jgi:dephospho-CoA kinase
MSVQTHIPQIRLAKQHWNPCTTSFLEQSVISSLQDTSTYTDTISNETASLGHRQHQDTTFASITAKPSVTTVAAAAYSPRASVLVGTLFCLLFCTTFRDNFACTQFNIDSYNNYYLEMPSSLNAYKLDFSTMKSFTATLEILQQSYRQANAGINKYKYKQQETNTDPSLASHHFCPPNDTDETPPSHKSTGSNYNLSLSTEENYESSHETFHGKFQSIRSSLDYSYHSNYTPQRQLLQDTIISILLSKSNENIIDSDGVSCTSPKNPWIVFTAGAMGSGKSYTIKQLHKYDRFPLDTFITVDPDEIRRLLPEFECYLSHNPEMAGEHTRKEAGFLAEMLTQIALKNGKNVLVDGSLKDAEWYHDYFHLLRNEYGENGLRIGILHVTAPREAVFERARVRSKITRRIVPQHRLEETLDKVPHSVNRLAPLVDFHAELHNGQNSEDIELVSSDLTWSKFRQVWNQSCQKEIDNSERKKQQHERRELDDEMLQILSKM